MIIHTNYQMYSLVFLAVLISASEHGIFFHKDISSSLLTPGVKDYGFPVKVVRVTNTVAVPVPYPVHVTKKVPFPITIHRPIPYPVPHPIPVQVTKPIVIQQAVPVPIVRPVAIPQSIFTPSAAAISNAHGKSDYYRLVGYQNYGSRPYFNHLATNHNHSLPTSTPQPIQDFQSDGYENLNTENKYGSHSPNIPLGYNENNYNHRTFRHFYKPSYDILPPLIRGSHGSKEYGTLESFKYRHEFNDDNSDENDENHDQDDDDDQGTDATNQKPKTGHQESDESYEVEKDNSNPTKE